VGWFSFGRQYFGQVFATNIFAIWVLLMIFFWSFWAHVFFPRRATASKDVQWWKLCETAMLREKNDNALRPRNAYRPLLNIFDISEMSEMSSTFSPSRYVLNKISRHIRHNESVATLSSSREKLSMCCGSMQCVALLRIPTEKKCTWGVLEAACPFFLSLFHLWSVRELERCEGSHCASIQGGESQGSCFH